MRSGKGMDTVPMKQPSRCVTRQETGSETPETGRVRALALPYGQIPVQPGSHGHGGIPAEFTAHHLQPRVSGSQALCKAHLLGVPFPPQKLCRHPGLHIPGHGVVTRSVIFFLGSMTV